MRGRVDRQGQLAPPPPSRHPAPQGREAGLDLDPGGARGGLVGAVAELPAGAGAGRGRAPTAAPPRAPPTGRRCAREPPPAPAAPSRAAAATAAPASARRAPPPPGGVAAGRAWPGSGATLSGTPVMPGRQARPPRSDVGYLPLSAPAGGSGPGAHLRGGRPHRADRGADRPPDAQAGAPAGLVVGGRRDRREFVRARGSRAAAFRRPGSPARPGSGGGGPLRQDPPRAPGGGPRILRPPGPRHGAGGGRLRGARDPPRPGRGAGREPSRAAELRPDRGPLDERCRPARPGVTARPGASGARTSRARTPRRGIRVLIGVHRQRLNATFGSRFRRAPAVDTFRSLSRRSGRPISRPPSASTPGRSARRRRPRDRG